MRTVDMWSQFRPWLPRAGIGGVLITIGLALLAAAGNDHWSATTGVALGQCAIGAAAWIVARPILASACDALGVTASVLPSILVVAFVIGVCVFAYGSVVERALVAGYLTVPGMLLDALFAWHAAHEQSAAEAIDADKEAISPNGQEAV